ncbi:hypothetical protein QJS10_CPB21g00411 [Acorus calamus]|uniref:Uncharacterized protein n=1 Tax=Acorus calamus TaxID=4465 RepID=A0AAV9C4W3_ACOCL|nr:hypothetical protein QJS10_CPB21g00411 [Acorus calamus]
MSRMNDSVETVNAAATAIVTAESRVRQVTEQVKDFSVSSRYTIGGGEVLKGECFKELMIIAS